MAQPWNKCDVCGRFIAFADFDRGAVRQLVTPDSAYSGEVYETLCIGHSSYRTELIRELDNGATCRAWVVLGARSQGQGIHR